MDETHVTKNYMTEGGDELVIGGKLTVLEGAEVTGLSGGGSGGSYTLPTASADTLGGVKAKAKSTEDVEVTVDENGKLFVPTYPVIPAAPANATASKAGLVKQAAAVTDAADTEVATLQTTINGLLAALRKAGILAGS